MQSGVVDHLVRITLNDVEPRASSQGESGGTPMSHMTSFAVYRGRIRQWWNEPVDYAEQVAYFSKRSISNAIKVVTGLGIGLNAATALAILLPAIPDVRIGPRIATELFAALMFFWAYVWCFRPWPSRRMSIAFIVTSDIGITLMVLQDPNWLTGFYAFNTFGLISIHLLFFDGHPDGFLTHGTLSEKNVRGGASQGGGLKNFRPIHQIGGAIAQQRNAELTDYGGSTQFEKERYRVDGHPVTYHAWLKSELAKPAAPLTTVATAR